MKRAGYLMAIIILMMNVGLMMAGSFGFGFGIDSQIFQSTYKQIPGGLNDLNAGSDFQNNLQLVDENGVPLNESIGSSFISNNLTFLDELPIIGPLFPLFKFAVGEFLNATFGLTLVAIRLGLPSQFIIFLGIMNLAIMSFAAIELIKDVLAVLGISK